MLSSSRVPLACHQSTMLFILYVSIRFYMFYMFILYVFCMLSTLHVFRVQSSVGLSPDHHAIYSICFYMFQYASICFYMFILYVFCMLCTLHVFRVQSSVGLSPVHHSKWNKNSSKGKFFRCSPWKLRYPCSHYEKVSEKY
jgi:hypothetical protein